MMKLSIAIPASVVSDTPHLREKTSKIGYIGRAAGIFNVDCIIVYLDNPSQLQKKDAELIAQLLRYMETPQYLRRRLFQLNPDLQFAGILPPLRTPHHPLNRSSKALKIGEFREGVVLSKTRNGVIVDIGVERPALARDVDARIGQRVTVRVLKMKQDVEVTLADHSEIGSYWGFEVKVDNQSLGKITEHKDFDLKIATSKYGSSFNDVRESLMGKWNSAHHILIMFGSPTQGLNEIAALEGLKLEQIVDFVVNTVPNQGTETIRTEEAVLASLAVFNVGIKRGYMERASLGTKG
jgi:predicted SPOUT superfamily RNA methylase MTH1